MAKWGRLKRSVLSSFFVFDIIIVYFYTYILQGVNSMASRSLKKKLIMIMIALTAIPIIIITAINYWLTTRTTKESAYTLDEQQVKAVYMDFKSIMNQNFKTIDAMACAPLIQNYLANPDDEQLKKEVEEYVAHIDEAYDDGNPIIITRADGQQLVRSYGDCVNIADREYFKKAMAGEQNTSDIIVSKSDGKRIIINIVPVYYNGEIVGTVMRNYNLSVLHELMETEVIEENEEVLIVDNTGSVICHSAREIPADEPEDQSMNPFYTMSRDEMDATGIYESEWQGVMWQIAFQRDPDTGFVVVVARDSSVAARAAMKTQLPPLIVGIVMIIIAVIVAVSIATSFIRPIINMVRHVDRMAKNDFTGRDLQVKSKDELGLMSGRFNTMKKELREVLIKTRNNIDYVADSASQFSIVAEQSAQAMTSIAESTSDLAENTGAQEEVVDTAVNETDEMTALLNKVILNMKDVKEESDKTTRQANEGTRTIQDAVELITVLSDEMKQAEKTMLELDEQSKSISEITKTIADIASQTNLLSLNASIEAARAGEAGKGFAVVATEVGNLASESHRASEQISQIVKNIQVSTSDMVKVMKTNVDKTAQSAEAVDKAGDAFGAIANNISVLNAKIVESAKASNAVLTKTDEVQSAIKEIEELSNKIATSTDTISAATEEQTASMQEIAASSRQMTEVATELKSSIDCFVLEN